MTKTELTRIRMKRGQSVGFVSKSGLVRPFGHVNTLPAAIKAKIAPRKTRRSK